MRAAAVAAEVAALSGGRARVVAAVKGRSDAALRSLLEAGILDLGENRLQERRRRQGDFPRARWHFIGRLQTNKAKGIARAFSLVHSVGRLVEARALAAAGPPGPEILLQVNFGDPGKAGVAPERAEALAQEIAEAAPALTIRGLMTMPPLAARADDSRPWFRGLADLAALLPGELLSMGTSQDWRVAVEEGAHLLRLGRCLFA